MSQPLVCPTCEALRQSLARMWAERDAALAECTRLADVNADLQASVHRYAGYADTHLAERDAARAECERLRAVLQNARRRIEDDVQGEIIVQHDCWRHGYPSRKAEDLANRWADGLYRGLEIARTALDAGEDK